jgi:hypothetical protein
MCTQHDDMTEGPDATSTSVKTSQDSLSSTPGFPSLVYRDLHFVETTSVADDERSSGETPVMVVSALQLERLHDDLQTILDNDVDDAYPPFSAEAEASKVDQKRDQCRGEHQQHIWSSAIDRTYECAVREKWAQEDLHAALMHNCPWNDWVPPSESLRLFHDAAAATPRRLDGVDYRARVHGHVS